MNYFTFYKLRKDKYINIENTPIKIDVEHPTDKNVYIKNVYIKNDDEPHTDKNKCIKSGCTIICPTARK
jgi:ribosome-associated protein YbcJ (S4-like RNA binding protein)